MAKISTDQISLFQGQGYKLRRPCVPTHEYRLLAASLSFGVTIVHANLSMHILASIIQDGGNPFPIIILPVLNSVNDSSRHSLLLASLHRLCSGQVYFIHRSITGCLVIQEATCTHAHEYRLLEASS